MDSQNLDESQASEQELGSNSDGRQAQKEGVAQNNKTVNDVHNAAIDEANGKEEVIASAEVKAVADSKETVKLDAKAKAEKRSKIVHRVFTVIGIILCVILIPILIMNCIMIVQSFINKDKVPGIGKYKPMIVLTDSMYPVINRGDLIISEVVKADKVEVGDVISFYDPAGNGTAVVTHRVVELVTKDGKLHFRTKGDFNNTYDKELVPAEDLVGVYKDTKNTKVENIKVGDLVTFWHYLDVEEENTNQNANSEQKEPEYIDDKEARTYKVKEIKKDENGKLVFVVKKQFKYSVEETLEVEAEHIIGVFSESRRFDKVGSVAMFMQSTLGFIVCVFVPVVLLVGYDLIRRKLHDKGTKKDKDALMAELERLRAEKAENEKNGK